MVLGKIAVGYTNECAYNRKTAYIGTIGFYLNGKSRPLKNTTPDLYDSYEMMIEAIDNEVSVIVMEVSSQALDTRRVEGICFDIVCFTNLTEDHLDYHKTLAQYKEAKQKLFSNVKVSLETPRILFAAGVNLTTLVVALKIPP